MKGDETGHQEIADIVKVLLNTVSPQLIRLNKMSTMVQWLNVSGSSDVAQLYRNLSFVIKVWTDADNGDMYISVVRTP